MRIKLIALSLCFISCFEHVTAHTESGRYYTSENRHEFRIGYSDGLTLSSASFWGIGLSDALTGTERIDEQSTGVFGVGYRYGFNRFRVGLDIGFAEVSSKIVDKTNKTPYLKETQQNLLILPTAEIIYFKKGLFELYGSIAAGVDVTSTKEKGLTDEGKRKADTKADKSTDFAFQANPIAMRLGNNHIGGFIEAGLGYKGFVTAGISVRF